MHTNTFYITTAIAYPNGEPHIGHAYEMIATDAIARFQRLEGKDVFFLTGTDEHGIKMVQTAQREGISRRELADRNAELLRKLAETLNISNDDFIRTTGAARTTARSRKSGGAWQQNGDIYQSTYKGWYSVRDEAYFDEDETLTARTMCGADPQGRRSSGSRRRAISSGSRPIRKAA